MKITSFHQNISKIYDNVQQNKVIKKCNEKQVDIANIYYKECQVPGATGKEGGGGSRGSKAKKVISSVF